MQTVEDIFHQAEIFIELFNNFATKHNLEGRIIPDHICYKCESKESFETLRALFEAESEYMYQSIISGRRIAVIRFKESIQTSVGPIYFLELSDQKPNLSQRDGFDHIEAYPVGWSYSDMVFELQKTEQVLEVIRPHHSTHDIDIGGGFLFRCTQWPLIEKIKSIEMI